jgi:hypothetical protein
LFFDDVGLSFCYIISENFPGEAEFLLRQKSGTGAGALDACAKPWR